MLKKLLSGGLAALIFSYCASQRPFLGPQNYRQSERLRGNHVYHSNDFTVVPGGPYGIYAFLRPGFVFSHNPVKLSSLDHIQYSVCMWDADGRVVFGDFYPKKKTFDRGQGYPRGCGGINAG